MSSPGGTSAGASAYEGASDLPEPPPLALDADLLALAQEPRDRLGPRPEHRDVHEVDAVLPLARRRILATVVDGDAHLEDGHAALRAVQFGVPGKVCLLYTSPS